MASIKQDRNLARTPSDVERRYKLNEIEPIAEKVESLDEIVVDGFLSATSTNPIQNKVVTSNLANKVNKVEGKDLSTNDFTNEYKDAVDNTKDSSHTHSNKEVLDNIEETDFHTHTNKEVLDKITEPKSYDLSTYKVTGLTILRSSCIEKNKRVCINFVGTLPMQANITTKLFDMPVELRPTATKDFVVYGQDSNTTGYLGYGYLTNSGILEVRFTSAVSSYIRLSFTYDLD